ncbi:MAG: hypothetical protein IPI22_03255 [Bacteroidetes bacterium]|nr:hypothetical protein [Bacteroidota bacterium]
MFAQTTTIQKVTASGCYFYSNASKTTISVQVAWTGANSSDIITVKVDNDITRIINVEDMYDPGTGSNVAGPIKKSTGSCVRNKCRWFVAPSQQL